MESFYQDYIARLQRSHDEIVALLEGLPDEALDWSPGEGMNSIAVLAVHTAGAERFLLGDVIAREPSGRDRPAEFVSRGISPAELVARLGASLEYCRHVLDSLSLEDLSGKRFSSGHGGEITVGWTLSHLLCHTSLHQGHMEMTRHMWELSPQD